MDAVGRYTAIFLAVILIILFPLQYIAQSQGETIDDIVSAKTTEFTDTARHQGYITLDMYENLVKDLDCTGELYDITIEAAHPVSGKEISENIKNEGDLSTTVLKVSSTTYKNNDYLGANSLSTDSLSTVKNGIPSVIPSYDNTDLNVLSLNAQIRLFSTHTHTADCYVGHNHAISGCSYHTHYGDPIAGTGCYTKPVYHTHDSNCYGYAPCNTWTNIYVQSTGTNYCSVCKKTVSCATYGSRCPNCGSIHGIGVVWSCGHFGISIPSPEWCTNSVRKLTCSISTTVPIRYDVNCGISAGWSCGIYTNDITPICDQVVLYITATNPTQTVNKGGTIISTATATYLDGHTGTVNCTVSGFNANTAGAQMATLTYTGLIGNARTSSITSCTVSVTVVDSIPSILTVTPSTTTVYNGKEPTYTVVVTYADNSTKTLNSTQYTKTGFSTDSGTKTVNFSYTENSKTVTASITITVKPNPTLLTVTPSTTTVYNGNEPTYTVVVTYEDNTTSTLNPTQYSKSGFTAGPGTKTVNFSYTENNITKTACVAITVKPNTTILTVTPSSTTVYNGTEPLYIVVIKYEDNTTKTLNSTQYTKTGFTAGSGTKNVSFTYTENGNTVTTSIVITVKPNLSSITASPNVLSIERYKDPLFTITANYDNSTTASVTGYTITGFNKNNLGVQNVTIGYTENAITRTAIISVTVTPMKTTCPICHTTYELDINDIDKGCPNCSAKAVSIAVSPTSVTIKKGESLPITVTAVYQAGTTVPITGWTSDFNPNIIGYQEVDISFQGVHAYLDVNIMPADVICPVCGKPYSLNDNGLDPGCPECSKQVVSINVVENSITIMANQQLPITVIATYKDNHTATITGWRTDFISSAMGTFDVTIYYQTASDHVTVIVTDNWTVVCPYCGKSYDRFLYPTGCPVCSTTVEGITASLRYGGTQVRLNTQLVLQIVLIYKDTHRSFTYSGYTVTGYRPDQIGNQIVTVHYGSLTTTLDIEVISGPQKVVCPNGHEYYINDDGSDPGCPYCALTANRDSAIFYFDTTYTSDIINSLYTDGIFHLKKGDYLTITVTQRDASVRSKIKKMFFGTNSGISRKKYTFGGEVL